MSYGRIGTDYWFKLNRGESCTIYLAVSERYTSFDCIRALDFSHRSDNCIECLIDGRQKRRK